MPPPMTTARRVSVRRGHARASLRCEAEQRAGRETRLDGVGHAHPCVCVAAGAQAGRELGEEVVRRGHGATAVGREGRDDGGRGREVGVDAIEHRRALRRLVPGEPEVVAAEHRVVVVEVAQEVDVLERRTETSRTVDELGRGSDRMRRPGVHEHLQAHQADHLGRAVDVRVVRRGVVPRVSRSVRIDAKNGATSSGPIPHSRAVRANACTTRFALKPRRSRRGSPARARRAPRSASGVSPASAAGPSTISSAMRTSA